jgi:hypothetical protein
MVDEDLIALFSQAQIVELECPLSAEGLKDSLIPCAVYVDNCELPGMYRLGPVRTALTFARRRPLSWDCQDGHITWTWGRDSP